MKKTQMSMISLDMLVPDKHAYRKFEKIFDFGKIEYRLKKLEKDIGRTGYGMVKLFKILMYQEMEDLSDRQMEEALKTNLVCKWFCGFALDDKTPDHSLFTHARGRIGASKLSKLFKIMKEQLQEKGYMSEVFTFVDSSHL